MENRFLPLPTRAQLFIDEASALHRGRYDYGLVRSDFRNSKTKVPIRCRVHDNVFHQTPHDHLKGQGCPDCGGRRGSSRAARAATFVQKAHAAHEHRYEYDETSFVDVRTVVRVRCFTHGWFEQRATNHLQGKGCARCARG